MTKNERLGNWEPTPKNMGAAPQAKHKRPNCTNLVVVVVVE